jgi:hypothetical protein
VFKGGVRKTLLEWAEQQLSPVYNGRCLWLFGIFFSGPRADGRAVSYSRTSLISHRTRKAYNQGPTLLLKT